jgi:hypothetical protein
MLEIGNASIPNIKPVAQVMPHATKIFQGVAIQDMMGACMASIFPEAGHHRQVKLEEITAQLRILDAKYERHVLMLLVLDNETGQHSRFVFRFDSSWGYTLRRIDNITPTGLNFTVLDNGIVVCLNEEEKIEIFSNKPADPNVKVIDDPAIKSGMKLCHSGSHARVAHGDKLYSFAVKKNP